MQSDDVSPSLIVIVPRAQSDVYRRLQQTLDGPGVLVVLDRRWPERRAVRLERPADRRIATDHQAKLAAGKWIVLPADRVRLDVLDADGRAILFLCCSQHAVPCERCQETYRVGWLARGDAAVSCPRCDVDLTSVVVAHALLCPNWRQQPVHASKPPVRAAGHGASPRAAAS